ncbi:hypothetical protein KQI65_11045 [bacterium]|nr:hypothetical protein [bacterium]
MKHHAQAVPTRGTQYLRLAQSITILLVAGTLLCSCGESSNEAPTLPSSYLAMRKSDLVHAPYHRSNPFDSVGIQHNMLVHHFISSTVPWDTLEMSHMLGRCQSSAAEWGNKMLGYSREQSLGLVQSAFALGIDSTARLRLAAYDSPLATSRERHYLRRIGEIFCEQTRFEETQRQLDNLEREILAEQWPEGNETEVLARMAISIARHSYAYWKRMMVEVSGLPSDEGALRKTATDVIIRTNSKVQIISAADVIAGTSAAEAVSGAGLLTQIKVGLISAGAVSGAVAVIVYFDDIVSFLNGIMPWNW